MVRLPTVGRLLAVVSLAVAPVACDCGGPDGEPDGGRDAGTDAGGDRDAGQDGGRDGGRDAATDGGPLAPFPGGWERVPWIPEWCDVWRPRGPAAGAVPPLRYEPCDPPSAGCEELVVDWDRSPSHGNAFLARSSHQVTGGDFVVLEVPVSIEGREYADSTVHTLDGTPMAVFRTPFHERRPDGTELYCSTVAVDAVDSRVILAYWAESSRWDVSRDDDDFAVRLLADDVDRLQHSDDVLFDLEIRDVLGSGNAPIELHYDGTTVIAAGPRPPVYVGSLGGGPWGEIATARTGDVSNSYGHLFDGSFYWSSVPADGAGWGRIRRRAVGSDANETFMEPADGSLSSFRTDGTWVAWGYNADDDPPDGRLDRTEIWGARVDGALGNPSDWSPSLQTTVDYPNSVGLSRPILHDGLYAYLVDDRQLEVIDLAGGRILRLRTVVEQWWESLLYLGDEYLFVVYRTPIGIAGMRRYRPEVLEGWEDL